MSKIINGVVSEYDIPMVYENKSTTNRIKNEEIFTRWQDPTIEKLQRENEKLQNNWNELKRWLEEEKDRLARECSQIYEDSLGKTRLVNEDIYNEVKNISDKMQELENRKV